MAIATNIVGNSIEETKKIFFPINRKFWLKIGLVSLLDRRGSSSFNYRVTNPGELKELMNFIKMHVYQMLAISTGAVILGLLFSIISYTFNFIFLESLLSRKVLIKAYFKKFLKKGISLFWFNLVVSSINLLIVLVFGMPLLITLIKNWGSLSWSQFNIPYLIFFVVLLVLSLIFFGIIDFIINNFVLIDMYTRNVKSFESFKRMLKLIRREPFESFIYLLMKIVLSIATAIISIIIGLAILLAFLIIGGIMALMLYLIYLGLPQAKLILIVLGVILAVALILTLIYAIAVILSPIEGFHYLYSFRFFNELKKRNKDIFKNA